MKFPVLFSLLALVAAPAFADGPLRIVKSDSGFLFSGKAKATAYSFDVPGKSIRTTEGEGRIFAAIDGVLVQLLRVPAVPGSEAESLETHRKTEVEFLEKNGGAIAPSTLCASLAMPHQEWRASFKGGNESTFVTVKIEDSILVLVVGANAKSPKGQADQQTAGICATLRTEASQ